MSDNIQLFENPEFGQVRVFVEDNEPLFVAKDIAIILGYSNTAEAIATHCKSGDIEKRYVPHSNGVGGTNLQVLRESNVYRLIMRSNLESAGRFQDWVTEEVLPSIRKTGSYSVRPLSPAELIIAQGQAMLALEQKQREQEMKIQGLSQDVDELKRVRVEAEQQLKALPLSEEKTPEKSLRAVVNELARQYQRLTGCEYSEVWNKAYKDLYYKYGISVNGIKELKKGESKLSKLERKGHLEEVKIILSEMIRDGGVD